MSPLISRIMLTILLFPLAALFNFVVYMFIDHGNWSSTAEIWFASGLTCAFIVAYWLLLWRSSVQWNRRRVRMTYVAGAAATVAGLGIGLALDAFQHDSTATYAGWTAIPLLWVTATIFIWRETPEERGLRLTAGVRDAVICPACGYNLTGLRDCRCPECGATFTLDELFAAQPAREAAEVES
jgi:hypothetical protein